MFHTNPSLLVGGVFCRWTSNSRRWRGGGGGYDSRPCWTGPVQSGPVPSLATTGGHVQWDDWSSLRTGKGVYVPLERIAKIVPSLLFIVFRGNSVGIAPMEPPVSLAILSLVILVDSQYL